MIRTSNRRIALIAFAVILLDQLTKWLIIGTFADREEKVLVPGFFKLVHWHNTGAAWSLFMGNNRILAIIAIAALLVLFRSRHHFDSHTLPGQVALGLIFGGIVGNLTDRLLVGHVTDFLYFYLERRGGDPIGFPAFNIADSAICVGVGLIFIASLRQEQRHASTAQPPA